jgi:hypothetical protein
MRRGGSSADPASTQQILELRDQGLAWNEIAEQVGMTVSGAWSRYRKARPPSRHVWAVGSRFSPTPWTRTLPLGSEPPSLTISVEPPTRAELTAARRAAHSLAALGRARVLHVPGADADDNAGDRSYLVLARPRVIMNDIRLRGLGVEGSDAAGRKTPDNQLGRPGLRWHQNEMRGDGRG